ncbi:MAG: nitrite reductase small subunit NirD, partial [Acidimicrobiales bacterium]
MTMHHAVRVCPEALLSVNRGVAALVDGAAVALFRLEDGTVRAVDNLDPCSGASVLSRGLVGDVDGEPTVASPMYKQRFSLLDGRCLDLDGVAVAVHDAAVADGFVHVT